MRFVKKDPNNSLTLFNTLALLKGTIYQTSNFQVIYSTKRHSIFYHRTKERFVGAVAIR